jgi:hypothetical protein
LRSSDPGSAIEGFRQKIPLHNQLTDLGMKLRQLNVAVLLAGAALLVEHLGEFLNRLALPRCNLGRVQFVLGRQLATVSWPLIASSATLALNSAENRLRVLMVIRPLYRRIHLTGLSQEAGPPLVTSERAKSHKRHVAKHVRDAQRHHGPRQQRGDKENTPDQSTQIGNGDVSEEDFQKAIEDGVVRDVVGIEPELNEDFCESEVVGCLVDDPIQDRRQLHIA